MVSHSFLATCVVGKACIRPHGLTVWGQSMEAKLSPLLKVTVMIFPTWLIWFIVGIIIAFLELYLPGFILLFFAIGCLSTAAALLVLDINLTQQILVFLITSISSLLLLRKWMMRTFQGASSSNPDGDFDDFPYGVQVKVLQKISPHITGRIQYRGTAWDAVADESIEPGETVEIVKFAGNSRQIFVVRKVG